MRNNWIEDAKREADRRSKAFKELCQQKELEKLQLELPLEGEERVGD